MIFASPIWLFGLLPWAGMVAYLLRGAGTRTLVPFLQLWPRGEAVSRRSLLRLPPPSVRLICLASLLAILAAAGPIWIAGSRITGNLSIVIDRGITMSGDARYRALVARCDSMIGAHTAGATITLIPVPGQSIQLKDGSWAAAAVALPVTAIDTRSLLQTAVADRLRETRDPVIVLTDQPIDRTDVRVARIAPDRRARNIGITAISARSMPHPQIMVRLKNDSAERTVHLRVRSGTSLVNREVNFTSDWATEFIDMAMLANTVSAEIDFEDDVPADNAAWLTRQSSGITLDVTGGLPAEVRRIATIFTRNRPAGRHVLLSDRPLAAAVEGIQIIGGYPGIEAATSLSTANDPLTNNVGAWPGPAADVKPPEGFRIVAERGGRPLIAVHDVSSRQVWVNLNLTTWSRTTDFVVFFSNVFEWFRDGGAKEFTSILPASLGPEWKRIGSSPAPANLSPGLWPGLYHSDDGRLLAVNAPATASQATRQLSNLPECSPILRSTGTGLSLIALTCLMALLCVTASVIRWPRH